MSRSRRKTAVLYWLPVVAVVGALFVAPTSNGAAALGTLNVSPGANTYGGQKIVFSGDMGSGEQRIFLQRRGSPTGIWSEVVDPRTGKPFTRVTGANGEFRFEFPAPAMNGVYFRLHSRRADTEAHQFRTVHQDADLDIVEATPAHVRLPRGFAVRGEDYTISVDTVGKPSLKRQPLPGRDVTLQQRVGEVWTTTDTGDLEADGKMQFGPFGLRAAPQVTGVFRVRLEDWKQDGDNVGWFPSLPFSILVVDRPDPVENLEAAVTTSSSVKLIWTVAGADPAKIVIARSYGGGSPRAPGDVIATLDGSARSFNDVGLLAGATYQYAVYTVTHYRPDGRGVYVRVPTPLTVTTDPPARGEG